MNPMGYILGAVASGVVAAFAWVAFWTVLVPEISNGQIWTAHEGLIVPVYFLGAAAPFIALFTKR